VAVLYESTLSGSVREVKELLPVAARGLGLTLRSWEVRAADDFDRVFAALNKLRPDGLYVSGGPLMINNTKRTTGFALKSRLPSMYGNRERVEAGGLMSYGADQVDGQLPARSILRGQNPEGRQACGLARRAANEVRAGD
jgi:ABC-type uncharacterized transport system substrate-binding protein